MSTRHQHDVSERKLQLKDGFSIQRIMRSPASISLSFAAKDVEATPSASPKALFPTALLLSTSNGARRDPLPRVRHASPLVARASLLEHSTSAKKLLWPQPSLPEAPQFLLRDLRNQSVFLVEVDSVFLRHRNLNILVADHPFQNPQVLCVRQVPWSQRPRCVLLPSAATPLLLLFHSAAAALILVTCPLLGALLALCGYCRFNFACGRPTAYLTSPPVFPLCPGFPALVALILREIRNPDSSCSTRQHHRHPAGYPASCEVGAVRALSSMPLLPPMFVPFAALTHLHAPSESSDCIIDLGPRCSLRLMVRHLLLSWDPPHFHSFRFGQILQQQELHFHMSGSPKASS